MMKLLVLLSVMTFSGLAFGQSASFEQEQVYTQEASFPWQVGEAEPMNCVNPGGYCDGSLPCCDSYNNACVRNRCMRIDTPVPTADQPLDNSSF